jgi:hypothetical protein
VCGMAWPGGGVELPVHGAEVDDDKLAVPATTVVDGQTCRNRKYFYFVISHAEVESNSLNVFGSTHYYLLKHIHHPHQPINVPTAGAQAFLMDYPQGKRAITTTRTQCGLLGANDCKYSQDQRLNVLSQARRSSK